MRGGAGFSAFLQRVIRCRFKNFVRSVRRRARRERPRGLLGVAGPDEDGEEAGEALEVESWATEEPPNRLAARESNQRLAAAVAELDRPLQDLWYLLALGLELRDAAHYEGISYDQAKRRRRKLIEALRETRHVLT